MEKLKLYYESNPPGVGKVAGLKLIRRLEELETKDAITHLGKVLHAVNTK